MKDFEEFINEMDNKNNFFDPDLDKDHMSIDVDDTRIPGGSKEEIEKEYDIIVKKYNDGTFNVSGLSDNIRNYLEDYALEYLIDESIILEDTVEGYEYHFKFEGEDYTIIQGVKDKTIFGIKKKDGEWRVMTKGNLFDPKTNKMTPEEMVEFVQRGIKYFNVRNPVEIDDVKESEWSRFFDYELKKRPGRINKKYVILKLHSGKAAAKWLAKH